MVAVITDFGAAWYFFTLEIAFKSGKQANTFFALKKSEQAEIVTLLSLSVCGHR